MITLQGMAGKRLSNVYTLISYTFLWYLYLYLFRDDAPGVDGELAD